MAKAAEAKGIARAKELLQDETAPTAVEYALMIAGIAVVIVAAVAALGTSVNGLFNSLATDWPG